MTTSTSLIDLILSLLRDPAQRIAFQQDPEGYLASCGDVSPEDIKDAITLADGDGDDSRGHSGGSHHNTHVPAPPPVHQHPGESDHAAAVRYLNTYVTNNYTDARETTVDQSIHQDIDTHGGDVDQDFDNHSVTDTGDGSVAAGGNVSGTVTTGDGNQVGQGNVRGTGNVVGDDNQAVTGAHDTTSFGSGAASSSHVGGGVSVGDGSAYSGTAAATTDHTDNSIDHSLNDQSDHSVADSLNNESDHSDHSDHSAHDSLNDEHDASTHAENSADHSFNTNLHA